MAYDGQLMMVKVQFETGAVGTPHTHYHSQATYVASGRFMLTIGEERVRSEIARICERLGLAQMV